MELLFDSAPGNGLVLNWQGAIEPMMAEWCAMIPYDMIRLQWVNIMYGVNGQYIPLEETWTIIRVRWFGNGFHEWRSQELRLTTVWIHFPDIKYRKTSYISHTLVGNKIVDNSDLVGASPVGAAPTISSFST